ncbi:MAG: hypothetical protein LBC03_00870 [Nitrososphaerota archaeon]|jgi:hypothetical protein|nr:hypothetical protein [Nitrososphaerota archaeon]
MELNKVKDERAQKGLAQNIAPMYSVLLILTTISLIIKIALKLHPAFYITEIIALIVSPSYYSISTAQKKILFVKEKDEAITSIKNSAKNNSYNLHFWIFLIGGIILGASQIVYPIFLEGSTLQVCLSASSILIYMLICIFPLSIARQKAYKKGLLVTWNSEKTKTATLKRLKLYFTIQAICSGTIIVTFLSLVIFDYTPPILLGVAFGVAINVFIMSFVFYPKVKKSMIDSEKYADKEVELAEILAEVNEEGEA